MRYLVIGVTVALTAMVMAPDALAFCGFYVAKADSKLFNQASRVVLVRDGDRTVVTMANDFKGDAKEFAVVVPVPTVLEKGQVRVADRAVVERLDAFTAPRLVEYHDPDPCPRSDPKLEEGRALMRSVWTALQATAQQGGGRSLGVTVEAEYTVGEYDILILSARQSDGLETWLQDNGYRLPAGAAPVLASYLKQGMKFFVARVNLAEQAKLGVHVPAPAPDGLRVAEVHAPDPARHRERRRGTGALRLRVDADGTRGDHELPHGPAPHGRRAARSRGRNSLRSTGRCSRGRSSARTCGRCSSSTPGTWAGATPAQATRPRPRSFASSVSSGWTNPRRRRHRPDQRRGHHGRHRLRCRHRRHRRPWGQGGR